jgi:hypothetical protein
MNDQGHYQACFDLMQAVAAYRHQPIHRRLAKLRERQAMVHLDVVVLTYYLPRICGGCILEIGAFRGGMTVAAAWGVRNGNEPKKIITQVDELVNSGRLLPLGYYGFETRVGRWQGITPLPAQ